MASGPVTTTVDRDTREDDIDIPPQRALPAAPEPERARRAYPEPSEDTGPRVVHSSDQPQGIGQFNVRMIVRHSEHVAELFEALAKAQAKEGYGDIKTTETARVSSRKGEGSSYTYQYETLRDVIKSVQPHLAAEGIAIMQFPFPGERSVTIRTMLGHKSGQWIYNDLSAMIPMPDPQAVGSGITYLRRYAMKSICGVSASAEDDDGQEGSRYADEPDEYRGRREPREAPRPAQRRSEQQTAPAEPAPAPAPKIRVVGSVLEVLPSGDAWLVRMANGEQFGTKNEELAKAAGVYAGMENAHVEAVARPSRDPGRLVPILESLTPTRKS